MPRMHRCYCRIKCGLLIKEGQSVRVMEQLFIIIVFTLSERTDNDWVYCIRFIIILSFCFSSIFWWFLSASLHCLSSLFYFLFLLYTWNFFKLLRSNNLITKEFHSIISFHYLFNLLLLCLTSSRISNEVCMFLINWFSISFLLIIELGRFWYFINLL